MRYEWQLGWRYVRAGRGGRDGYLSFISGASVLGIALGVAALIVVLSVLNGFSVEVRDRMLSVIAHVELFAADGGPVPEGVAATVRRDPQVKAVAPFIAGQGLLGRGDELRPVRVRGIDVALEAEVSDVVRGLRNTALAGLVPGQNQIVLGIELARELKVAPGQPVTLVQPDPTQPGGAPRMVPLTVAATFEAGHFEYDSTLAFMLLPDAQALFGAAGASGLQLRLLDRDRAGEVGRRLAVEIGPGILVRDWTRTNRQWFESVQIQKQMLFLILALIVAVAAFNLVSTLVMTVTDKRADIAILRTLGASPASIMGIFIVQGAVSGFIGTMAGLVLGLAIAFNVGAIVRGIEQVVGASLLPSNIYLIDHMPSLPLASDIVPIVLVSLALSFVATLYPSWRASRLQPAEALRYE
ncbi:MAG: cell division protein FtsX [Methylibium sp. NZG]|nr:MAG: cell division protein FtsX [Methylibium sp. NZG]